VPKEDRTRRVVFSGGGAAPPMATLSSGTSRELTWPTALVLPQPVFSGDTD